MPTCIIIINSSKNQVITVTEVEERILGTLDYLLVWHLGRFLPSQGGPEGKDVLAESVLEPVPPSRCPWRS